jgi:uncharacterized membrane protein
MEESDWLEHSVQVEVQVPVSFSWELWSDLEQMPRWMNWIKTVKIVEDDPDLSQWTLASTGLEFKWLSRTLKVIPEQIVQWEAVDGLSNRGAVRFYDRGENSIVKLTVAYGIPGFLGKLMDNLIIGRIVEATLRADLRRFRKYAEKAYQKQTHSD